MSSWRVFNIPSRNEDSILDQVCIYEKQKQSSMALNFFFFVHCYTLYMRFHFKTYLLFIYLVKNVDFTPEFQVNAIQNDLKAQTVPI